MRKRLRTFAWTCALAAGLAVAAARVLPASASRDPSGGTQSGRASAVSAFEITEKSIRELQEAMASGAVTSRQLVDAYLARIAAYDQAGPRLNAFITLNRHAQATGDALDRERRDRGPRGPLHGIPIAVKDNFDTADMPTTGGSVALATHRPPRDAFQVERLRAAGAIVIGKTNLHELAAGIVTVSSLGDQTRNPYDPARNPGGSSGGTGAAVAASFAAAGMGSDTCGSIRIPASHNSLVGLRPTSGLSSRAGVIPLSHTQDVAGPLARSIEDLAILLDATVGEDPRDPVTAAARGRTPASYAAALETATLRGARIGLLTALFGDAEEDAELAGLVRGALNRMQAAGAVLVDVTIPDLSGLQRRTGVIDYEFKFDLADYLSAFPAPPVRTLGEILDRGLHHAALTGTFRRRNAVESRDSDAYREALARRERLRQAVLDAMTAQRVTALAYPTMRRKPAPIGESQSGSACQLSAATGLPALSVPAALTSDGLPVGLELLGRPFGEAALLGIGHAFERLGPVRRPPPTTPPLTEGRASARPGGGTRSAQVERRASARPSGEPTSAPFEAEFAWDGTLGVLRYRVDVRSVPAADVILVAVRQHESGPILGRLLRQGQASGSGEIPIRESARDDLLAGRVVAQFFTTAEPLGGPSVAIRIPR